MAVSSTRRGLATKPVMVRRAGARMALSLLGTNNPKHNLTMADQLLTISAEEFAKKWNFDPIQEMPLATGRYDWCSMGLAHAPHAAPYAHAAHDPQDLRTCLALPTVDLGKPQGRVDDLCAHTHAHTQAHVHTKVHTHAHTHANTQPSALKSTDQKDITAINTPETQDNSEIKEDVGTVPLTEDRPTTSARETQEDSGTKEIVGTVQEAEDRPTTSARETQEDSGTKEIVGTVQEAEDRPTTSARKTQEDSGTKEIVGTVQEAEDRPTTSARKTQEDSGTKEIVGTVQEAEDRPTTSARETQEDSGTKGAFGTVPQAEGTSVASPPVDVAPVGSEKVDVGEPSTSTHLPRPQNPTRSRQTCITDYVRPHRSPRTSSSREQSHTSKSKKRPASALKDHLHQPPHKKVLLQIRA